ncbi:MAG: phnE [Rhizobacter sp.]|nr:phnE [Rhizobacter sp.]
MNTTTTSTRARAPAEWTLRPPYGSRSVMVAVVIALVLWFTGQRVEMGRMLSLSGEAVLVAVGLREQSQVSLGLAQLGRSLFPLVIAERTQTTRIEGFDREHLPFGSHLEMEDVREPRMNPQTLTMEDRVERIEVLVEPFGYLTHVLVKMLETLEIALWGTLLAALMSVPLAFYSASNYTPNALTYNLARVLVSLLRAMPELISALFLVLAYGFGPIAGVLALALHGAGFLGKFYAEDIENADAGPQEALRAIGAGRLAVLRHAVLPQVMPKYIAYTLYILDRNVRMATVVGLVGAGGIGQELKGRYDMYHYSHVATILVIIFITVFLLDRLAAALRARNA